MTRLLAVLEREAYPSAETIEREWYGAAKIPPPPRLPRRLAPILVASLDWAETRYGLVERGRQDYLLARILGGVPRRRYH